MSMRLFVETVGCQMNVLDSELVVARLRRQGYEVVDRPADADTILLNTCSVRRHAEEKVYSHLGRMKQWKTARPELVIGVIGCMAQNHQRKIFDRADFVDLVVGPGQLDKLPALIEKARRGEGRQVEVSLGRRDGSRREVADSHESFDPLRDPSVRSTPFQAYVRTQVGCDKFCAYCIVPSVRGPEQCRPPHEIVAEGRHLADGGCLEITLLGQTVNSYRYKAGGKTTRLADLLCLLHEIEGLRRLKFVTNYPRHMTKDLLDAVAALPKVSPYLHVPAQSGSDAVLRRMKRTYTAGRYREMIDRIRRTIPDAAISSDFIVGFCGETEDQFQETVELVRYCRFKNSYIFKYSERSGTRAAELYADDVPHAVKQRRNNELLAVQDAISEEDNRKQIGRTVEVLVEGPSKKSRSAGGEGSAVQMTGRTHGDRIVVFDGAAEQTGRILPVTIYDATAHTLLGMAASDQRDRGLVSIEAGPL